MWRDKKKCVVVFDLFARRPQTVNEIWWNNVQQRRWRGKKSTGCDKQPGLSLACGADSTSMSGAGNVMVLNSRRMGPKVQRKNLPYEAEGFGAALHKAKKKGPMNRLCKQWVEEEVKTTAE